jgi:hypothetical protein
LFTLGRTCPLCHGTRIYQSHFRVFDLPFLLFLYVGVRCGECDNRFYRPRFIRALPRNKRTVVQINKRVSA